MATVDVTRTYLEMRAPAALQPVRFWDPDARVRRRAPCTVSDYRRLYTLVGEPWQWRDRLEWSDAQVARHLANPAISIWELLVSGESAGFFELRREPEGAVEIAYFGLAPAFIGRGLGGALLTVAVEEAWRLGAARIWLHTCTLDSPHALPNYLARGFRVTRSECYRAEVPV